MNGAGYIAGLTSLVLTCATASATLSSTTAAEVDRMQATFTNEIAKYDKAHEDAVTVVRDQYAVALVALERKYTSAGALDAVLAVKKEFTRFTSERALRDSDLLPEPADLQSLQRQFIAKFSSLPADRAAKVVRLAEFYAKSLKTLEENLTKQRLLEDAIEVKRLREGVSALPEVAGATLVVSTMQPQTSESVSTPAAEESNSVHAVATAATSSVAMVRNDRHAPKKYTGTSTSRIRDQFDVFWKAIQRQNWDAAEAIIDPVLVKEQGSQRVQGFIRMYGARIAGNESPNVRVDVRGLEVDSGDLRATSVPRIWLFNDWHELRPLSWIQVDGDWYIDVRATMESNAPRRDERNPRRDDRGRGR